MSYAEFPSTCLHAEDGDHHELIEFYIEVRDKYQGTLDSIEQLKNELAQYRADMQREIGSTVEQVVARQLAVSLNDIETKLAKLNEDVLRDRRRIDALESSNVEIIKRLDSINDKLAEEINKVYAEIDKLHNSMLAALEESENIIFVKLDENKTELLEKIAEETIEREAADTEVRNYAYMLNTRMETRLEDKINEISATASAEAITWLWQYGCCHGGFSALEWYHLTNVCNIAWGNVAPTAWEWYVLGKDKFRRFRRKNKMYSPVSGKYVDVRVALLELAEKLNIGSISAAEYDELQLSSSEYDSHKLTAGEYDWEGKELLDVQ